MFPKILVVVSDEHCARVAQQTLELLAPDADGTVVVLGVVRPFRTIYAHTHPLIGRCVRNLLWQTNGEQLRDVQQLVRATAANFAAAGWEVHEEVCEGPIAEEIVRHSRLMASHLVIVGLCLGEALPLSSRAEVWHEVVRKSPCPVLVVRHMDADEPGAAAEVTEHREAANQDVHEECTVSAGV